jgi:hypothetical protein
MTPRASSTTLSYVLTLSIATMLVGGLIVAGGTFVKDHREQVIRQELQVIGEHVASNVDQVDRYARAADDLAAANVSQTFPDDVTGATYVVRLVDDGGDARLFLNATRPSVSVDVNVTTATPIATASNASGGTVVVKCQVVGGDCNKILIDNA